MARGKAKQEGWLTAVFLLVEAALYTLILTGRWVVSAQYASICLCALFVLVHLRQANYYILGGLLCTLGADYFLVVCRPQEKLTAMLFFLGAQTLYAWLLHRRVRSRHLLVARLLAVLIIEAVTVLVLRDKMDALAAVSVAYYAMLVMNIVVAFRGYKREPLLAWALVLFLLCDTVVGLKVAADGYLTIAAGSWLHRVLFCGFPLDWAFYLPSQVMLAFCGRHNRR